MSIARITIEADTSGIAAAFARLRADAKTTENTIAGSLGRAGQRVEGIYRRSGRVARDESTKTTERQERDARRAVMFYLRGEEEKRVAARKTGAVRAAIEREATSIVAAETRKRGLSEEASTRLRISTIASLTQAHDRAERTRTAATGREHRSRQRIISGLVGGGRVIGQTVAAVGRGGMQGAREAHGVIQDARHQRAIGDRTIGHAVRNAGGSTGDVRAARERVRAFVAETGIDYGDVASALETGQARGSSLEAGPGRTPAQALDDSLALIREANAENADPGQYLAGRGRLAAAGLRGDALRTAMRFGLGAAQSGQVEFDQIITQGLPGATRLMESRVGALGPNATEEQRQTARLDAWRESVATQEVLAASGGRAGHTANTLASLQGFMNTPRRQEAALNNIKAAERQINRDTPEGRARAAQLRGLYEGDSAIFEHDPTRTGDAMRLRAGVSPAELATRVAAASGGDAQAGANIFAGGGHGNPQAFLVNMRNLMAVLGGERGQRIQTMMAGRGVSDAQVAEHTRDVESDALSTLTRNQEIAANALTDNTTAVNNLSNRIGDWQTRNPIGTAAIGAGVPLAAGALGVPGSLAAGAVLSAGYEVSQLGDYVTPENTRTPAQNREINSHFHEGAFTPSPGWRGALGMGTTAPASWDAGWGPNGRTQGAQPPTAQAIGDAVATALRASPVVAAVPPVAAAQAASRQPPAGR